MNRRRICVVTGSRAEYGLLYWLLHDLRAHPSFELQLVVTGMHLAHEYGNTVQEIERDGFTIDRRVEMLLASDTGGGNAKSVGLGVIGMADALSTLAPDLVVVLGDRFEILAAAQACLFLRIPLAHIAGGDTTEGAFDESIRHAITKLAHVHFVTNDEARRRVRQLGEDPQRIFVVGSPGLDHLQRRTLLDRTQLEASLGTAFGERNFLVTFHPVTLAEDAGVRELQELLHALDGQPPTTMIWITRPNADVGGRAISAAIDAWAAGRPARTRVHTSLGQHRYTSLMAQVDAVVGNSSSGLYEAPSLRVPTVDIGDRQRGRLAAASVIHCAAERTAIAQAIDDAMHLDCSGTTNPYGDGRSTERIIGELERLPDSRTLLRKQFHFLGSGIPGDEHA